MSKTYDFILFLILTKIPKDEHQPTQNTKETKICSRRKKNNTTQCTRFLFDELGSGQTFGNFSGHLFFFHLCM